MKVLELSNQEYFINKLYDFLKETKAMDKRAEINFLIKLAVNHWKVLSEFSEVKFSKIGFDIEIIGKNQITIELKSSSEKQDYFCENKTKATLFGNAIKYKDINLKTGLLKADFLVFATKVRNEDYNNFDFWIFSRDDLSELYPLSQNFMPSHIHTLMINKKKTHITDRYNLFSHGVFRINAPLFDKFNNSWTNNYPKGTIESYDKTWCPLINEEHKEISKLFNDNTLINNFNYIFNHSNQSKKNNNFKKRECNFYNKSTDNPFCIECQSTISEISII